jgi:hypothetical protein
MFLVVLASVAGVVVGTLLAVFLYDREALR